MKTLDDSNTTLVKVKYANGIEEVVDVKGNSNTTLVKVK